jgi:pilus assembly protein CpaD
MTADRSRRPGLLGAAALALLAATALGGCRSDREITGSIGPDSYESRHPIVVAEADYRLDLPVGQGAGGINARQRAEIAAFAASWRSSGRGVVTISLPHGSADDRVTSYVAPEIRTLLAANGINPANIRTQRYAASGPVHLAPVRLSFPKLTAKVPHPCGVWPDDLGHGGGDWNGVVGNREYYNYGCATQQNLAAQVADPEDLLRPRATDPAWTPRRQTVIEKYTKGESTATEYPEESDAAVADVDQ